MKAKAHTLVLALALLGGGCAYVRPPAQDRAVWEHQQKPKLTDGEKAFYEMIQGLWLGGNALK